MALTIELAPGMEGMLRGAAARRGVTPPEWVREVLEERLAAEEQEGLVPDPTTGADPVAYWQAEGVVGAWADRADVADSVSYARSLRRRAEGRRSG